VRAAGEAAGTKKAPREAGRVHPNVGPGGVWLRRGRGNASGFGRFLAAARLEIQTFELSVSLDDERPSEARIVMSLAVNQPGISPRTGLEMQVFLPASGADQVRARDKQRLSWLTLNRSERLSPVTLNSGRKGMENVRGKCNRDSIS
jgi:hypothetical protein